MGSLFVVLVILGCVAYQYLKGTFVKSFVVVITSICAGVVAFGYFELLANFLIGREILASWAAPLSFVVLFISAFAILQTIAVQLTRQPIDLGFLPERIGRVIFGVLLGLVVSGLLLTAVAMTPVSAKYPYQRFDETNPEPEKPSKVLLNADGFATGWFSIISSGSFSGKRSFAVLHPAFLDQLFLNRHEINNGVSTITIPEALKIPRKAVWPAPEELKGVDGRPVQPKSGHTLTIVRVGIRTRAIKEFTPSQLRVICKKEVDDKNPLAGKGENIYPVGYMEAANRLRLKKLTDRIEIKRSDAVAGVKEIDFAFYVPDGFVPVLVELKQNSINQLPSPVTVDQAPAVIPFTPVPERTEDTAEKDTSGDAATDEAENTTDPNSPR